MDSVFSAADSFSNYGHLGHLLDVPEDFPADGRELTGYVSGKARFICVSLQFGGFYLYVLFEIS